MACEWHTDDMRFERKIKLSFLKPSDDSLSKYLICEEFLACNGCFGLFTKIKNGSYHQPFQMEKMLPFIETYLTGKDGK